MSELIGRFGAMPKSALQRSSDDVWRGIRAYRTDRINYPPVQDVVAVDGCYMPAHQTACMV